MSKKEKYKNIDIESTSDKVLRVFYADWLEYNDDFLPYSEFKKKVTNDELAINLEREVSLDGEKE